MAASTLCFLRGMKVVRVKPGCKPGAFHDFLLQNRFQALHNSCLIWNQQWSNGTRCSRQLKQPVVCRALSADPFQVTIAEEVSQSSLQSQSAPHIPVLLHEILGFLEGRQVGAFLDGTLGAGGHSSALIRAHPELKVLVGLDVDPTAHERARPRLEQAMSEATHKGRGRPLVHIVHANFREMKSALKGLGGSLQSKGFDGMLLDLGMSSMQVDLAERGFSFLHDGPMDMRMDPRAATQAENIVNEWPEEELARILRDYGEERYWRSLARKIVLARAERGRIRTTAELVQIIGGLKGGSRKGKRGGPRPIHPATRTFQALRIAVNDELRSLELALPQAIDCLAPGGRLGVISFHSLEDRIVKRAFRAAAGMPVDDESDLRREVEQGPARVRILTRRPVTASEDEKAVNPRSRSAKLRFVEKL